MSVLRIAPRDTDRVSSWVTCGKKTPRSEVVFLCQVLILYTVIIVSIYNLTVELENSTLWTALLSSFLGYPLPSPTMKTKHVYLTLPRNSSMNYFPNNTLTHYTTKLPKIMDLDGTWQIGLAEIHYPHSWYNVKNKEAWLKVHFYKESELQKHLVLLPDGYYASAKRIIIAIEGKKYRTELKKKFDMGFSEINHKINMKVKKDCQVIISPLLQSMLGFRKLYSRRGSMFQIG